ncbi:MAG TPA: hypothetical protein VFI25_16605 [Planctomycetota bacterium]|nr:hypothetical protein [Planctomycetota bacterium]
MKVRSGIVRREGERGIALILTLLVLLILLAVVSQLTLSTRLDYQSALAGSNLARMDRALEAGLEEAMQVLKDDAEGGAGGAAGGLGGLLGMGGGAGGRGGNPFGNLAGAAGGAPARTVAGASAGGGGAAGTGAGGGGDSSYDCFNDSWAKPARQTQQGIEVTVVIEDENRKLNLLAILAPDEELARQSRDRLVRVLDTFREGTPFDLDLSTAETLVRSLEEWLRGRTRNDDFPRPRLLSNEENSTVTLPVTGDELLLVEGFDDRLLNDFRAGDLVVPGLLSHVTVWTSLEVAPEGAGESGAQATSRPRLAGSLLDASGRPVPGARAGSPGGTPAAQGPAAPAQAGEGGGGAGTSLGAAINVNTAPRAVLASLLPFSEIPSETIEAILRFRNEELETEETARESPSETLGLEEEEEPPKKFFTTLDELDQIPEFGNLYPEIKQRFKQLLTTQSEVFTIWLTARIPPKEEETSFETLPKPGWEEDRAGLTRRVRAVVLRRSSDAGTEILPLVRWELRSDRRYPIPDFPEDVLERLRR